MIHIQGLRFGYENTGFRLTVPELHVSFSEKLAVIGPSGSGKTTLLNLIAGILEPQKGAVNVGETQISALSESDRRDFRIRSVGLVFQDFDLIEYLNVMDNILHPYRITRALKLNASVRARAVDLAEQMGIGDKLKRRVNDLSQGEKQRAAICRALLPEPELILADEATGNLDPENKIRILELLFDSIKKRGATLIAVTHDHELLQHFDRVVDFNAFQSGSHS